MFSFVRTFWRGHAIHSAVMYRGCTVWQCVRNCNYSTYCSVFSYKWYFTVVLICVYLVLGFWLRWCWLYRSVLPEMTSSQCSVLPCMSTWMSLLLRLSLLLSAGFCTFQCIGLADITPSISCFFKLV